MNNPEISKPAKIALKYFDTGWHPVPLRPGKKSPLWRNTTGKEGKNVSRKSLSKLPAQNKDGTLGIGLRLDSDIIGIDVDAHKDNGRGLAAVTRHIGPLPPTYRVTARFGHNPSGIRLYRLPLGTVLSHRAIKILKEYNIDIIRHEHRSVTVSPTVHPDIDLEYKWYGPNNLELSSTEYVWEVPSPHDLPELPLTWVDYLTSTRTLSASPVATSCAHQIASEGCPDNNNDRPSMSLCTSAYSYSALYQGIYDLGLLTTHRNDALVAAVRESMWYVLRGGTTEEQLDEALFNAYTMNGYIEEHGEPDYYRSIASAKKFAKEHFTPSQNLKYVARIQDLVEKVAKTKLSQKSKEAFFTLALYARQRNFEYVICPTRAVGLAVDVSRNAISKYVHAWEAAGFGTLKVGGQGAGGASNEFHFYLNDEITDLPADLKVDLNIYQPQVDIFTQYIQDARAETYRKNGQTPPGDKDETHDDDTYRGEEMGMPQSQNGGVVVTVYDREISPDSVHDTKSSLQCDRIKSPRAVREEHEENLKKNQENVEWCSAGKCHS